jgi:histone deacetylase 6
MDEEDFVMGEEAVVQSTEVNGNGNHVESTIDPTVIALSGNLHVPFASKKEQLPILSYGEPPSSAPAVASPNFSNRAITPTATTLHHSRYSSPDSDEMDIIDSPVVKVEVRIPPPPRFPPLPYSSSKTGLVYDARMRYHAEPLVSITNGEEIHPEDPRRIHEIFHEIQEAGLVQGPGESEEDANDEHCWRIQAREASRGEICLIHTPEHYDFIKSLEGTPLTEHLIFPIFSDIS